MPQRCEDQSRNLAEALPPTMSTYSYVSVARASSHAIKATDAAPRASQAKGPSSRTTSTTIDFDIDQYLNELGQGGGRASTASVVSMNMSARSTQDLSIDDINDLLEDKGRPVCLSISVSEYN